ncbi:MAG TPA: VOC family protein [Terriglobales bacterium]|nr:VOC family protein [Terriglobales bacterium]
MRSTTWRTVALATLLLGWHPVWVLAQGDRPTAVGRLQVKAVGPIEMTVAEMDRSLEFYTRVLTFEKVSEVELAGEEVEHLYGVFGARVRLARLKLGDESIELVQFLAPRGRAIPPDSRSNDRWFQHVAIIVSDMDRAYQALRENKVEHASSGPQRLPDWNRNAAGIRAFYFKDPDGHPLEILQFPEGKGSAKWHRPSPKLFLGIDHTAIVVADTETSLKFYRDLLGLEIAGESENYGTEQEHLNNVFGARLRITSLRAPAGPGIELLEYLSPRDGRPFPEDEHANDLVHRQTELEVADANAGGALLRQAKVRFVSSEAVAFSGGEAGFHQGLVVRDPDGHALSIVHP